MPVAMRYWCSGKHGALVRAGIAIDSDEVGDVECGAAVSVGNFATLDSGKRRARLLHPVRGWCSAAMLSPGASPAWDLPGRPRILALHGGGTNGEIFRAQLYAITTELGDAVEWVFPDGIVDVAGGGGAGQMRAFFPGLRGDLRSWLRIVEVSDGAEVDVVDRLGRELAARGPPASAGDIARSGVVAGKVEVGTDAGPREQTYRGAGPALARVVALVREHEPDGILGFSQGANVASLLLAALEHGGLDLGGRAPPKFLIAMCGTHWGWAPKFADASDAILEAAGLPPPKAPLYSSKLETPSLHVLADDDPRRPFSSSFRDLFAGGESLDSPTSHKPPVEPRFADAIHDFIRGVLRPPGGVR